MANRRLGRFADAARNLEEARDGFAKSNRAPDEAAIRNQGYLAYAYLVAGREQESIRLFEETRTKSSEMLGPIHKVTCWIANGLALAYVEVGRASEAIPILDSTRDAETAALGIDHPSTQATLANLGNAYNGAGRPADAIRVLVSLREPVTKRIGSDHQKALIVDSNLALAYCNAGRLVGSIQLYEQLRVRMDNQCGEVHKDTIQFQFNLARAYRHHDVIKSCEVALQRLTASPDQEPPQMLAAFLQDTAFAYSVLGRHNDAVRMFEQDRDVQIRCFGPKHTNTLLTLANLANAYTRAGRANEAIPLLVDARKEWNANRGDDRHDER